jgi:hypothetical protein
MAISKSSLSAAVIGAVVVALAFLLNPSPERHRQKIKETTAQRSPLAGALGLGHLTAFVSEYHSLVILSYTTVNEKTVSVGALGVVYVMDGAAARK